MANQFPTMTPAQVNRQSINYLLSPPEMERSESFGSAKGSSFAEHSNSSRSMPAVTATAIASTYGTPPVSPYDPLSQKENNVDAGELSEKDPQLFHNASTPSTQIWHALFPSVSAPYSRRLSTQAPRAALFSADTYDLPKNESARRARSPQDVITEHMRSQSYTQLDKKPSREEYELTMTFQSNVFQQAVDNPRKWWEQCRRDDNFYSHYNHSKASPSRPIGVQKRSTLKNLAPAPTSRPRQPKVALPRLSATTPRAPRVPKPKRTPKSQVLDSFDVTPPTASPKGARVPANRDDTDYNALPDFCPPLDAPGTMPHKLKADWKSNPLDLSNDPDRHMLHETELAAASILRLSCATYLCSKRRIFQARVEALKIGKEFRKTDAQQACKIDVNKASRLWMAYEKIGWFQARLFAQHV